MKKIYYTKQGWICDRYPYDLVKDNENRFIEVDEETYHKTLEVEQYHAWRVVNGSLKIERYEETPMDILRQEELEAIQQWFIDNDWKVNKIIVGEWTTTDPRWLEYVDERQVKRDRQDELNNLLGNN